MARTASDKISKILAFVAAAFGLVALVLACVGMGTDQWYQYAVTNSNYISASANFFTFCTYNPLTGDKVSCSSRSGNSNPFCSNVPTTAIANQDDCNNRMRNASGLGIAGIIFIALGIVVTILMALGIFSVWFLNFIPGVLFFLASLFMLAGIAEGSRYLTYNAYSAILYAAGHLVTILAVLLSSLAGGRIAHACKPST